tara:strand:+ start:478 stop:765 length:288 start_codon:yes stop_codon:yes gene_type:complete
MDKRIINLQKQLQQVLQQIDVHKEKYGQDIEYGNLNKFLEFASRGAQATNYQEAAQDLFAAIGEINKIVTDIGEKFPDNKEQNDDETRTEGKKIN